MVLLKAEEFEQSSTEKKAFNLNDIETEAREIIESGRRRAREILEQAQQEISRTRQQAQTQGHHEGYEKGFVQGREEGYQQARQDAGQDFTRRSEDLLNSLASVCRQFDQCKQQLLWQAEQATVALALAIARKVVKQAGLLSSDVADENVKAALEMVSDKTNIIIQISPADWEHLKKMTEKDEKPLGKFDTISFEIDENLTPGSSRVITSQGEIDARLETQLNRIADELLVGGRESETELIHETKALTTEEQAE